MSLRINNFLISLTFHRKITPVPFTSLSPCGKQASIGREVKRYWVRDMPGGRTSMLIAIIDDNDSMQDSLCDLIESGGFEAQCFGSAKAFLESDLHRKAACLIVDVLMPKMSGLELQVRLNQEECNVPIIFITAFDDAELRAQAMKEGAVEFLTKPFDHQFLLKILRCTLDNKTYGFGAPRFAIASSKPRASSRSPREGLPHLNTASSM
jgi:CheY-like chemotaxis protein